MFGGLQNLGDVGAARIVRGHAAREHVTKSADRREQVVEVVRDAAGELSDRFQLASVTQLVLEAPARSDVSSDREE